METLMLIVIAGSVALALLLVLVLLQARARRGLISANEALARRVADLEDENLELQRRVGQQARQTPLERSELVITGAGLVPAAEAFLAQPQPASRVVPDQLVLSRTFGEPLVKLAALGHGLRRALSPESRNRIRFAVRQEIRRARKQRRRDLRAAYRDMQQSAGEA